MLSNPSWDVEGTALQLLCTFTYGFCCHLRTVTPNLSMRLGHGADSSVGLFIVEIIGSLYMHPIRHRCMDSTCKSNIWIFKFFHLFYSESLSRHFTSAGMEYEHLTFILSSLFHLEHFSCLNKWSFYQFEEQYLLLIYALDYVYKKVYVVKSSNM